MDTIYKIICELSKSHIKFKGKNKGYADLLKFDLVKKRISNGKTVIMDNGEIVVDEIELANGTVFSLKDKELIDEINTESILEEIEKLYYEYKHSVPNKHSSFIKCNFKGKTSDELTFKELTNGQQRTLAQYKLECFILFHSIKGNLKWKESNHFFWKSEKHPDLVLFKEWYNPLLT